MLFDIKVTIGDFWMDRDDLCGFKRGPTSQWPNTCTLKDNAGYYWCQHGLSFDAYDTIYNRLYVQWNVLLHFLLTLSLELFSYETLERYLTPF